MSHLEFVFINRFPTNTYLVETPNNINPLVKIYQPETELGSIFKIVALSHVIPDGKIWADATPKLSAQEIVSIYEENVQKPDFDLAVFVHNYFELPGINQDDVFTSDTNDSTESHINNLWHHLRRNKDKSSALSTLIPLPNDYIVPGGRFNEIYYWDSYFTMLGLSVSGHHDLIESMIENFAWLMRTFGFIPNGNRSYYLSRSQPPFFALMVDLLCKENPKFIVKYTDELKLEYHFWMKAENCKVINIGNGILNRYFDQEDSPRTEMFAQDFDLAKAVDNPTFYKNVRSACESGWDFSSRWFSDSQNLSSIITCDILPVDLNCLLYFHETMIAKSYQEQGNKDLADLYQSKADDRKSLILTYFWNEELGYFFDYNYQTKSSTNIISAAGLFPLFFGICTQEQAEKTVATATKFLLKPGGIATTNNHTGQQWDAPNGWAPLQWIAFIGFKNYGFQDLASDLASRWLSLNDVVFKNTGKMLEKYNVEDLGLISGGGEYPVQDGFGWTNGVYLAMKDEVNKMNNFKK